MVGARGKILMIKEASKLIFRPRCTIEIMQNNLVRYVVELAYPINSTELGRIRAQPDRLLLTKLVNRHVVRLNVIGQPHSVWSRFLIWKCSKPITVVQKISGPQPLDQEFSL